MSTDAHLLMVDVNSYHVPRDLRAHYATGRRGLGIKATQGIDYTWAEGLKIADQWHKLGGWVVFYAFLVAGVPGDEQARYFLDAIKPHLRDDDVVCADIEGQPAAYRQWSKGEAKRVWRTFRKTVDKQAAKTQRRWVYGTYYFLRDNAIRPPRLRLRRRWRLWLAAYQSSPPPCPPGWKHWHAWQYTDAAPNIPGMPGPVDDSRLRAAPKPTRAISAKDRELVLRTTRVLNGITEPLDTDDRKTVASLEAAALALLKRR